MSAPPARAGLAPAGAPAGRPARRGHGGGAGGGAGAGLTGAGLTGAGELVRFALRRDRVFLPVWIYALTAIATSGGYALKKIYGTAASRAALAATVHADPTLSFLYGQLHGTSPGAVTSWRYLTYAALAAALMSIFLVVRHTRADEETGRLELIGSAVVGRNAALAVSMLVALTANLIVAVLAAAALGAEGMPLAGAAAFGAAEAGCGLAFAAIAVVAAQISGTARGARSLAITLLAVAFLLRAIGDSSGRHGGGWVTWLSPIGWAELVRPFTGDRWWVLALPVATAVAGTAAGFALAAHRDSGAGLVQPRPGRPAASRWLAGPAGLAWRLQRAALAGWTAGFLAGGLAIGVLAKGIGQILGSGGRSTETALTKIGGQAGLTSAYLAACMSLLGLVAAAYTVSAILRLHSDEAAERAEPVLAAAVGRLRWAGSYLLVAVAGTGVILVAGGFGMGLGYGLAISQAGTQLPRLIGSSLAQWPAALCVGALGAVAVGLLPRWSSAIAWTALAVCGLIGVLGPALNLSRAALDISPFTHVPRLPGGVFSVVPLLWLTAFALAAGAVALAGLRRRDIG